MTPDPTEQTRREMIATGEPQADLAAAESGGKETWDTDGLQREFEVLGFQPPFVVVTRKSDGATGTLEFAGRPRRYFGWEEYAK